MRPEIIIRPTGVKAFRCSAGESVYREPYSHRVSAIWSAFGITSSNRHVATPIALAVGNAGEKHYIEHSK